MMRRSVIARLAAALLILGLAACNKSSNSQRAAMQSPAALPSAVATVVTNGAQANVGETVYANNCATCHQATGRGVAGEFPPLAGNPAVTGDPKAVIHTVKFGLSGKISVAGSTYDGMMPAWGQQLSNAQIAAAITYIRSAWQNTASAVSERDVSAVSQ